MTVERREEHTEVVNYNTVNGRPVVVTTPMLTTIYQTETTTSNPYPARRTQVLNSRQAIFLLFGILEALLGIRFVLGLLAANPTAGFAQLIYGMTAPFLAPFVGLFGQPDFGGMVFEWNALIAIVVYALLAGLLVKLMVFLMGGNTRKTTYTTITSRIDNA